MARISYHHGDLRQALVDVGVELARADGPGAVVLREAARRLEVSPAAAYRHFHDRQDLLLAVRRQALSALGQRMLNRAGRCDAAMSIRPCRNTDLTWTSMPARARRASQPDRAKRRSTTLCGTCAMSTG